MGENIEFDEIPRILEDTKGYIECGEESEENEQTILYNTTYTHTLKDFSFGNIPKLKMIEIYKDGRPFSHFIEPWLAINYPLIHITGCKQYDHTDVDNENIKYDQKTFTHLGCKFMPSNMIGEGRTFNKEIFEKKAKKLIYIIISNINFPEIKIKFVKGVELIIKYPNGKIPLKDFDKFFN
jgi:hypothetical protein